MKYRVELHRAEITSIKTFDGHYIFARNHFREHTHSTSHGFHRLEWSVIGGSLAHGANAVVNILYYWCIKHHLDSMDWTLIGGSRRVEGSHADGGSAVISSI
jgi:hypothetical protein